MMRAARARRAAGIGALVVLLGACGGGTDGGGSAADAPDGSVPAAENPGRSGTGATVPADPARARDLTVDPADFPAGFTARVATAAEAQAAGSPFTGTFSPEECGILGGVPPGTDLSTLRIVTATSGTSFMNSTVAVASSPESAYRRLVPGPCSELTVTVDGQPPLGGAHAASLRPVDPPTVDGGSAMVLEMSMDVAAFGRTVTTTAVVGYGFVGGYLVVVQGFGMPGTSMVDPVRDLLATATDRVAAGI